MFWHPSYSLWGLYLVFSYAYIIKVYILGRVDQTGYVLNIKVLMVRFLKAFYVSMCCCSAGRESQSMETLYSGYDLNLSYLGLGMENWIFSLALVITLSLLHCNWGYLVGFFILLYIRYTSCRSAFCATLGNFAITFFKMNLKCKHFSTSV